jgi:hypothetical protein
MLRKEVLQKLQAHIDAAEVQATNAKDNAALEGASSKWNEQYNTLDDVAAMLSECGASIARLLKDAQ